VLGRYRRTPALRWACQIGAGIVASATCLHAQGLDEPFVLETILVREAVSAEDQHSPFPSPGQTVIARDQLQREFPGSTLSTVLDTVPGVTTNVVAGDPSVGVAIRGLQDDGRVAVTLDGARQNFGRSGHSANQTFAADTEFLRSVQVVRGPTGTDAATGAIGGTLALRTVGADDLIAPDAERGGEARLRFGTLTAEPQMHGVVAQRIGPDTTVLVGGTRVELDDYTAPNGRDVIARQSNRSFLLKLERDLQPGNKVTLGLTTLGSEYFSGQRLLSRRNRLDSLNATLNFTGTLGLFDEVDATLFHTGTRVAQRRVDDRAEPIGPKRGYRTDTFGLRATAGTDHALFGWDNRLTLLLDTLRDDVDVNDPTALGGSLTAAGTRRFLSFMAENTTVIGPNTDLVFALRFDDYELTSDEGESTGSQVSPSLTLRHHMGPLTVYGILARAFRPPTLSEALVNGQHPEPADFLIRPNPALSPERAMTYEIGATLGIDTLLVEGDRLDARLTVYRSDVQDYIALEEQGTLFDPVFQFENVDEVRIEGAELEVSYEVPFGFARLSGQFTEGTDRDTGETVSGVAPDGYGITAGWRSPDRMWEIGGRYTRREARENGTLSSDAWNTWDLFLTRSFGNGGSLSLALNNITDETYTPYLKTEPEPGFNALASLSLKF